MESINIKSWKKSAQNNPISLYGQLHNNQKPVLIIGGIHGDEPEGVHLAENILNWLQTFPVNKSWLLIPNINPDGFQNRHRCNSNGVDLNRNFPEKNWSTHFTQSRYYPGEKPNSELEVQSLIELILQNSPQLIIHCHSWKPMIVYTGDSAIPFAKVLSESSEYELKSSIGYETPGSLGEYGWNELKIPVICIEEQDGCKMEDIWPRFKEGFKNLFDIL